MFNSWKNYVHYKSGGDCSNVRFIHGDSNIGLDDSRDHHTAYDLLVYDSKESSSVLQRHDASLGNCAGYSFEVTIDLFYTHIYYVYNINIFKKTFV